MSAALAWMPLYVADYLADTRHLSTTEHGAYLLLIMHAWTNHGLLPLDEDRLARIAGLPNKEWSASRNVILQFFDRQQDGYRHKRIDAELSRTNDVIEKRRRAGKTSAARRRQQNANMCSTHVGTQAPTPEEQTARQPQPQPQPQPQYVSAPANAAADTAPEQRQQPQQSAPQKIPIPEDWQPSPADLAFVQQNTLAAPWSAEKLRRVIHEFVAHYRSRGNLSADWSADFRRWVLRQPRFDQQAGGNEPDEHGFRDPILRACAADLGT